MAGHGPGSPRRCDNGTVHAVAVRFDLHVPASRSLKAKRAAIRPVVDGLRHRFKVSVAEVDHQDQWQRASIGVALVDGSAGHLEEVMASVERFVAAAPDVELLDTETAWLETDRERGARPARQYPRTARVNEVVRETLAEELERMSDPRLGFVTLTGVEVSPDIRYADVYYSVLGTPDEQAESSQRAALGEPRICARCSAGEVRLKFVPELRFREDPAIAQGQRIEEVIRSIHDGAVRARRGGDARERRTRERRRRR